MTRRPGSSDADRLGPGDLMEMAADVGPVPLNVGALLLLDAEADRAAALAELVAERAERVPRLSQRLVTPSAPWQRPWWQHLPYLDLRSRVEVRAATAPGDRETLLADATRLLVQPLPRTAPLWRATVLTGLHDGRCALVLVLHHVLADGLGGLAVLGTLADDVPSPRSGQADAGTAPRSASVPHGSVVAPAGRWGTVRRGLRELGGGRPRSAAATSLNRPTGAHRALVTAGTDLAAVRTAARVAGATVNDALLVAATGATAQVLAARGESPPDLVVSVPVSARAGASAHELGNQVGVMPVRVPLAGERTQRLRAVAAATAAQRASGGGRGASAALVGPAFRVLAASGLLRRFVDHQRLVNLFLTNLRGPAERLSVGGAAVTEVVPLTSTQGNVALAFAALSYAGRLGVTAVLDPDVVTERDLLGRALQAELDALSATPRRRAARDVT